MNTKDFGKALLWYAKQNGVNDIGNLKLQKLAYYCQGYSLAINNEPIFDDQICAYNLGPVTLPLYHAYRKMDLIDYSLFMDGEVFFANLDSKFQSIIKYVVSTLGGLSSFALVAKTHHETPWLSHSTGDNKADSKPMTHEELKSFFILELAKKQDDYFVGLSDSLNASQKSIAIPKNQTEEEFVSFISSL